MPSKKTNKVNLIDKIESDISEITKLNRDYMDSEYALGYNIGLLTSFLREEGEGCQKRFENYLQFFLNATKNRLTEQQTQN